MPASRTRKCRMHGGSTPTGMASPHYVHGERQRGPQKGKLQVLDEELYSRVNAVHRDAVKNLEESIVVCGAIEMAWMEMIGSGLTVETWKEMQGAVKEYRAIQKEMAKVPPDDCRAG